MGDGGWINGGFFVLSPEVGRYIEGDATVWEQEPMQRLAADGQLSVYFHHGFLAADGHVARQTTPRGSLDVRQGAMENW